MYDVQVDVLERHHSRNRRPRPPSPARLLGLQSQGEQPRQDPAAGDVAESEDDAPRHKRHSKTPRQDSCTDPTQLGFYPAKWKDFLEECKVETRTYAAVRDPWPRSKLAINGFISDAIDMVLQKWRREEQTIEKHYYPKHRKAMCKLVCI